jgi:ribosomal protein L24
MTPQTTSTHHTRRIPIERIDVTQTAVRHHKRQRNMRQISVEAALELSNVVAHQLRVSDVGDHRQYSKKRRSRTSTRHRTHRCEVRVNRRREAALDDAYAADDLVRQRHVIKPQ